MRYLFILLISLSTVTVYGQSIKLFSGDMDAINVKITSTNYRGKNCVRLIGSDYNATEMAVLKKIVFKNGTIEVDVSGDRIPGTDISFRGFIGLAFRVQTGDSLKYEIFFIRPTLARDENQLRRNHAVQYMAAPDYTWPVLRKDTPGMYETYADMVPGEWIHLKIKVENQKAWLYVNNASQPTLIVNDLKLKNSNGALALWIGPGTDGYFSNLNVSSQQ